MLNLRPGKTVMPLKVPIGCATPGRDLLMDAYEQIAAAAKQASVREYNAFSVHLYFPLFLGSFGNSAIPQFVTVHS